MAMIQDRNMTAHPYDESVAREITARVAALYPPPFVAFAARMDEMAGNIHG